MKMKVRVTKLQAAIHKYVESEKKRFERETEKYTEAQDKAEKRYIENVRAYLAFVSNGGKRLCSYELQNRLERGCNFPSEPKKAQEHKELLVRLDLAEDQVLVVDDHSDYMKFLGGKCVCR